MSAQQDQFQSRLQRLHRKHTALKNGYSVRVRQDGMIVIQPRRPLFLLPVRFLILFAAALLLFKSGLLAALGSDSYAERVARLQDGTALERAGAVVMQADPVSEYLASQVAPLLH